MEKLKRVLSVGVSEIQKVYCYLVMLISILLTFMSKVYFLMNRILRKINHFPFYTIWILLNLSRFILLLFEEIALRFILKISNSFRVSRLRLNHFTQKWLISAMSISREIPYVECLMNFYYSNRVRAPLFDIMVSFLKRGEIREDKMNSEVPDMKNSEKGVPCLTNLFY